MLASRAKLLLVLSAIALAKHVWFLLMWIRAFDRGETQAERVQIFLNQFPHSLLGLSSTTLTWMLILLGIVGGLLAVPAGRIRDRWRPAAIALIVLHALFLLWYLFTMM
ncbi:MAG: hypothetical protein ACSLFE_11950 [Gemmatimonadaceae bacterium]